MSRRKLLPCSQNQHTNRCLEAYNRQDLAIWTKDLDIKPRFAAPVLHTSNIMSPPYLYRMALTNFFNFFPGFSLFYVPYPSLLPTLVISIPHSFKNNKSCNQAFLRYFPLFHSLHLSLDFCDIITEAYVCY